MGAGYASYSKSPFYFISIQVLSSVNERVRNTCFTDIHIHVPSLLVDAFLKISLKSTHVCKSCTSLTWFLRHDNNISLNHDTGEVTIYQLGLAWICNCIPNSCTILHLMHKLCIIVVLFWFLHVFIKAANVNGLIIILHCYRNTHCVFANY